MFGPELYLEIHKDDIVIYFFDGSVAAHVSAQRWRVYITNNNGHSNTSIVELQWRDISGNVISTSGGTASASSIFSGSFPASGAFDGVIGQSNRWATAGGSPYPSWLAMAFTGAVTPYSFTVTGTGAASRNDCPRDFIAEYSTDGGSTWFQQGASVTAQSAWGVFEARTFNI